MNLLLNRSRRASASSASRPALIILSLSFRLILSSIASATTLSPLGLRFKSAKASCRRSDWSITALRFGRGRGGIGAGGTGGLALISASCRLRRSARRCSSSWSRTSLASLASRSSRRRRRSRSSSSSAWRGRRSRAGGDGERRRRLGVREPMTASNEACRGARRRSSWTMGSTRRPRGGVASYTIGGGVRGDLGAAHSTLVGGVRGRLGEGGISTRTTLSFLFLRGGSPKNALMKRPPDDRLFLCCGLSSILSTYDGGR